MMQLLNDDYRGLQTDRCLLFDLGRFLWGVFWAQISAALGAIQNTHTHSDIIIQFQDNAKVNSNHSRSLNFD